LTLTSVRTIKRIQNKAKLGALKTQVQHLWGIMLHLCFERTSYFKCSCWHDTLVLPLDLTISVHINLALLAAKATMECL